MSGSLSLASFDTLFITYPLYERPQAAQEEVTYLKLVDIDPRALIDGTQHSTNETIRSAQRRINLGPNID